MYTDEDLSHAVQVGIFQQQDVARFRAMVASRQHTSLMDEEHFRLLSGFNDIFVVIAALLLLGCAGWLGGTLWPPLGAVLVAALSWLLAEYFVRQRRMALPAIVLLGSFVSASGMAVLLLLDSGLETTMAPAILTAGSAAAASAWLHWRRFRVPITVAAAVAVAVITLNAALLLQWPNLRHSSDLLLLGCGGIAFWLAMRWDMQDPSRQTRKSDVAFWLHLLAAPLIVHPVFSLLGIQSGEAGSSAMLAVVLLYLLFGLLSLAVDRRALLVSALAYVLYAFSHLLQDAGLQGQGFALSGLLIGSALLLMSAFWQRCRQQLLARLPATLGARLPPQA